MEEVCGLLTCIKVLLTSLLPLGIQWFVVRLVFLDSVLNISLLLLEKMNTVLVVDIPISVLTASYG